MMKKTENEVLYNLFLSCVIMGFDKKRKTAFQNDKSKRGHVDEGIKELVDLINSFDNMFTTSSCAGRISVVKKITGKKDLEFLFCSHDKVKDISDIKPKLSNFKGEGSVWLLFQPSIIHVCCKTPGDATWFLSCAKKAGYKRGGIISIKETVMVEIIGTECIEHLLYDVKGIYYTDECIERLLYYANNKFNSNSFRISRLINALKKNINNSK